MSANGSRSELASHDQDAVFRNGLASSTGSCAGVGFGDESVGTSDANGVCRIAKYKEAIPPIRAM
jgi:hypothetical protein